MLNPPSKLREAVYLLSVFINATLAVLVASDVAVSIYVVAGISGFNAVVLAMAKSNVTPDEE